ncbi:MAG: hypothetical protein IKZ25_03660 [Clostridia bacterium]|nr:hypothetical protein [Clostridia bacterium]
MQELCKKLSENKEDYILLSDFADKIKLRDNKNIPVNTKFLDSHAQKLISDFIREAKVTDCVFSDITGNDERRLCLIMPDYPCDFMPIRVIRANKSKRDNLSHRDYLGSLMGLGIKREFIGDIYVNEFGADIVVLEDISDYIMIEYKKAGRKQLELKIIDKDEIILSSEEEKVMKMTVSSMRLDCIISGAFNISRNKAAAFINSGLCSINNIECLKTDKEVLEKDIIRVRRLGKIRLDSLMGKSRKDKFIIEFTKW